MNHRELGDAAEDRHRQDPLVASLAPIVQSNPPTRRYLIGVSGGRDSVALLHALSVLGYRKLIVCHLNHQLRGRSSDADARFVQRLAAKYGFACMIGRDDVADRVKHSRESIETAARHARFEFFQKLARETKCHSLFLAHHADDQVETFLFNLFRGAGVAGLGAMRALSRRGSLRIVRPMLNIWRSQIDDYVSALHLKFREDASNVDTAHVRNRMRHQIIPTLEKFFGRDIRKSVWRSAGILAAENEWIESLIGDIPQELSIPHLRTLPDALQRRLVFGWLKKSGVPNAGFQEVELVRSLIPVGTPTAKINLPGGLHARRRSRSIFID